MPTLWLAGRQWVSENRRREARRREAILASIGRELQWNGTVARGSFDASNAHCMIGSLSSVAFDRHGGDLAVIAPESAVIVFEHCSTVGKVREVMRALGGVPERHMDEAQLNQWFGLCDRAGAEVGNTAREALKNLRLPLER